MPFANALVEDIRKVMIGANLKKITAVERKEIRNRCTRASRLISTAQKYATSAAKKSHLATCLSQVKSMKHMVEVSKVIGSGFEQNKKTAKDRVKWEDLHSAFDSRIRTGIITNLRHTDAKLFLEDCGALFKRRIQNALKKDYALKVNTVLCGEFQISKADKLQSEMKYLNTKNSVIDRNTNLDDWFLEKVQNQLLVDFDEFQERDSGFALKRVVNLMVCINKYNPLRAGSFIELPFPIHRRKACINVQNKDDLCFAWAVVSALYPAPCKVARRTSAYPHPKEVLNLKGIQFPMTTGQIPRFERQNIVSVNVYRLEKVKSNFNVIPMYLTKNKLEKHVNLLLVQDGYYSEDDDGDIMFAAVKFHFVWIKNMSRLLSHQLKKHRRQIYLCDRCLHYFYSEEKLNIHIKDCRILNTGAVPKVPTEDRKWVEFKDFKYKEEAPFIIYADTECLLVPVDENTKKTTQIYQKHVPFSVGYYVKCSYDDSLSFYRSYSGPDCMQWFVKELLDFAENVETVFLCDLPMEPLTKEESTAFYRAKLCHICERPFNSNDKKVRDHSHLTSIYRGPAHESCNLNYKNCHTIPVLFHNMSSYDGHMVLKALAEVDGKIYILPVNKEKYISFTKQIPGNMMEFRFIDSFRFLASGLDKLASYLEEYHILKSEFKDATEEQYSLLCRKGVFPYDFMSGWEKLDQTTLPAKEEFYNSLDDTVISDEQYAHAQKVWNSFGCQTIQQYSDLYLKTDVLLLADVFEQFRKTSFKTYGISPTHAYTLPGYAWQCMMYQMYKANQVKLELLTDLEMIMFIEKGIRGGLSQCSTRYSEANNKYMESHDPSKEEKYLMYFDINNQYGWAMSQYLPYGGFKWLTEDKISELDVLQIANDSEKGYVLEVDLKIPQELHDTFSDLPPCPEHRKPQGSKNIKLLATLHDKKEYIIHYTNLKQALALGVKLTKIYRVLSFSQSPWLKAYIDLNTGLRQNAKNDFEKNLFKLMNNAVFGKTMENIRNHSTVKLVTRWDGRYGAEALISRPEFKSSTIINDGIVIIELSKSEIFFNKPIYVGMCILDLAKTTIYNFHYNYMLEKFPNCRVLYTDTDSLVYEIRNVDIYEVMKNDCHTHFDTSDYSADNVYNIPRVNKKVLGMMKDENNGRPMSHFIGLRAKMYAIKLYYTPEEKEQYKIKLEREGRAQKEIEKYVSNQGLTKKIKGIKKSVIKNEITFGDYVQCLDTFTNKYISQNLIQSRKHDIHTVKQTKVGLSAHDDKRRITKHSVETLPWGHYSIMDAN